MCDCPEISGVHTTHYSVRVVFGPSRVRVGQKIPSLSRVASTRSSLEYDKEYRRSHVVHMLFSVGFYSSLNCSAGVF